ncbi:hypothetical protein KAR91_38040 [Candidatus Pacearchaeota archaeon]|nr:hypothetical protein [Candidatus Pacearchaeota archaeon]
MNNWHVYLLLIACIGVPILARWLEKKAYNNGVCPYCNTDFKYFDTDSQGGRGYRCKTGCTTTWVSWPWIDGRGLFS